MKRRTTLILLLLITAAGAGLRAWPIASRPLWFDEASDSLTSAASNGIKYQQFFLWTNDFEAAPFTFFLRRVVMDALGTEAAWAQRLPALLCAVACIPMAFWLGRVMYSNALGIILAALVAFDPSMVDLGQQARSYPMLMLLTLAAIIWAIKLLRPGEGEAPAEPGDSRHSFRIFQWLGLGLILGLAFCTTQFAIALWVGLGLAAAALLIGGWWTGRPHPQARQIVVGFVITYAAAGIVAAIGLYNLLTKDSGRGWGAAMTYPQIAWEILRSAKDLIGMTPAGLIVYPLAAAGLYLLYRRCRTSAVVVAAIALAMVLLLFPFRKTHHFMAPRYLSLLQPAVWVGLAMLAVGFKARPWRLVGAGVVAIVLAAGLWHSIDQDSWFTGPDTGKWLTGPQIMRLRDELKKPGEAVAFQPQVLEKLGRWYGMPMDARLDDGLYFNYQDRPDPRVPASFDAPATWLVIAMVDYDERLRKARKVVDALAEHYHVALDPAERDRHLRVHRTVLARFSEGKVEWQSVGVGR